MAQTDLTDDQKQEILAALEECVVVVQAGGSTGTGFFISARQVMTCRHVIEPANRTGLPISVRYGARPGMVDRLALAATLRDSSSPDWPDVAILDVPAAADARCVVMDSGPVPQGTPLLTAGYPKGLVGYQPQHFTAGEGARDSAGKPLLRITGDVVTGGMSGSPVVSLASGLVCGILGLTKSSTSGLGGFAALFCDFFKDWPYLDQLNDRPPEAARNWVRILTATQFKNAGRKWDGVRWGEASAPDRVDLELEQGEADTPGDWRISVSSNPAGQPVQHIQCKISDLGDGVMRAIDGWSRRQPLKLQDEVEVLGDVLHRAMLPKQAVEALRDALTRKDLRFRVCVDQAPRLGRLPWEYACGDDRLPFAASKNMTFSRFADVTDRSADAKDEIQVLAIIEFPESISDALLEYRDETGKWVRPSPTGFVDIIRRNAGSRGQRIQVQYALNEELTRLEEILADPWDIVHYIGFAVQDEGKQELAVALGARQVWRTANVSDLEELLDRARCRLFIAEFHKLGPGQDMAFPADLSGLTSLLKSDSHAHPQALIVTQYPMDLVDLGRFNDTFYERIDGGHTVEEAVQFGRREVYSQRYQGGDVAAFGSFVVTTTRPGEVHILRAAQQGRHRASTGASARGDGGEASAEAQLGRSAEPDQVPETDAVVTVGASSRDADEITRLRAQLFDTSAPRDSSRIARPGPG